MDQPTAPTPPPQPARPAVTWEPPVLASPPPAPPARTLAVPVIVAVCLAIVFAAGVVGVAVVRRLVARAPGASSAGFDLTNDWRSPDELMRIGNQKGGLVFRRQLARAAERATRRSVPGSLIVFDEAAVIDDLGSTMRGRVGYRGRTSGEIDEGVHVDGQQRHYFHPKGAVIVDAVCITGLSDCERRDLLLDTTEGLILEAVDQPGVDALLPASGRCEVEARPFAGTLATCQFDDEGLVLSLQKLSLEETRRAMNGLAAKAPAR